MPGRPTEETRELARARLLPRPDASVPHRPGMRLRRRGWGRAALVLGLVATLAFAAWQEGVAGEAQSRLAMLSTRFDDLQADVASLRAENEELRSEAGELREENERLAGELAVLRASTGGSVDEQAVVALVLPYLRDRVGASLESLADVVSLDQLGDLLARGLEQLGP